MRTSRALAIVGCLIVGHAAAGGLFSYSVRASSLDAPDLAVTRLTALDSVQIGRGLTIEWTVRNQGRQTAAAEWTDAVYLSTDARLDLADHFIEGRELFAMPLQHGFAG